MDISIYILELYPLSDVFLAEINESKKDSSDGFVLYEVQVEDTT